VVVVFHRLSPCVCSRLSRGAHSTVAKRAANDGSNSNTRAVNATTSIQKVIAAIMRERQTGAYRAGAEHVRNTRYEETSEYLD
jgi:hypothetical protein